MFPIKHAHDGEGQGFLHQRLRKLEIVSLQAGPERVSEWSILADFGRLRGWMRSYVPAHTHGACKAADCKRRCLAAVGAPSRMQSPLDSDTSRTKTHAHDGEGQGFLHQRLLKLEIDKIIKQDRRRGVRRKL